MITPYGSNGTKAMQVEEMFNNIAPAYDSLNHQLSWNIDRRWRAHLVRRVGKHIGNAPANILDVATGTADLAIDIAKALPQAAITAIDLSEGMMEIGKKKVHKVGLDKRITFTRQDATALTYPNATFDAVTAAFGIRNFDNLTAGLAQMARVLKNGGTMVIIELTTPITTPMKQLFKVYSHTVLPAVGRIVSGDGKAYSYLTASIEAFPQGERMMEIMESVGMKNCGFQRLTAGICTMYYGTK